MNSLARRCFSRVDDARSASFRTLIDHASTLRHYTFNSITTAHAHRHIEFIIASQRQQHPTSFPIMALKRKRSSPSVSSPFSDTSSTTTTLSSNDAPAIPFFYHPAKPVELLPQQTPTWSWPTYEDSQSGKHLNSRTRKRHRDDRPDEEDVYGMLTLDGGGDP